VTIIFLNGCTSSGKSSIAAALQARLVAPYLRMGIDDAFSTVPPKYHQHKEGFFFDRDERGLVRLNMGPVGRAALRAHRHGAAAAARSGANLILDEVLLPGMLADWLALLDGLDVFMAGVRCELGELERREIALVHADVVYDIEVDTTRSDAEASAAAIAAKVESGTSADAVRRMRRLFTDK
jgi:chloramphenicol 3-O phosphotransferase